MTFKNMTNLLTEIGKQPMQEQELLKQGLQDWKGIKPEEQLLSDAMTGKHLKDATRVRPNAPHL